MISPTTSSFRTTLLAQHIVIVIIPNGQRENQQSTAMDHISGYLWVNIQVRNWLIIKQYQACASTMLWNSCNWDRPYHHWRAITRAIDLWWVQWLLGPDSNRNWGSTSFFKSSISVHSVLPSSYFLSKTRGRGRKDFGQGIHFLGGNQVDPVAEYSWILHGIFQVYKRCTVINYKLNFQQKLLAKLHQHISCSELKDVPALLPPHVGHLGWCRGHSAQT